MITLEILDYFESNPITLVLLCTYLITLKALWSLRSNGLLWKCCGSIVDKKSHDLFHDYVEPVVCPLWFTCEGAPVAQVAPREAWESEDLCSNSGSNSTWIIFRSYSNYYVKIKKMQSPKNNSQEQNYTTKGRNTFE